MTGLYGTPKVMHIQERDSDGNTRIVRYYREDVVNRFVTRVDQMLKEMTTDADRAGKKEAG